jgi:hypothetical protein
MPAAKRFDAKVVETTSDRPETLPAATTSFRMQGNVSPGFEAVREAFSENFIRRGELGGACCAFYRGEKVVDLWGGTDR